MIIFLIVGLLLGAVVVIFALQNIEIITITFFSWKLTGSLALILFLTLFAGITITALLILPKSVNNYFKYRKLKKENERLEEELRKQKELISFSKKILPTAEEISNIETGDR